MEVLLQAAYEVLKEAGTEMHYRVILAKLAERGYDVSDQATIDALYNGIYNSIRKDGEHSRFRRVGRALFCASETFDPGRMKLATPNSSKNNPDREVIPLARGPRVCGLCKFIEFNGIQEAHMQSGTCGKFCESGRVGVQSTEAGCELWSRQSKSHEYNNHVRAIELKALVGEINRKVQNARRRG
jgi:hypothetical protein